MRVFTAHIGLPVASRLYNTRSDSCFSPSVLPSPFQTPTSYPYTHYIPSEPSSSPSSVLHRSNKHARRTQLTMSDPTGVKERLAAAILRPRRVEAYLPFMVGAWLDAAMLGLITIVFIRWLTAVRQTDRMWVQWLVPFQMATAVGFSGVCIAHWCHVFLRGYGQYLELTRPGGEPCFAPHSRKVEDGSRTWTTQRNAQ